MGQPRAQQHDFSGFGMQPLILFDEGAAEHDAGWIRPHGFVEKELTLNRRLSSEYERAHAGSSVAPPACSTIARSSRTTP
jgi:hypothetical protein